jgi:hypothetical protein
MTSTPRPWVAAEQLQTDYEGHWIYGDTGKMVAATTTEDSVEISEEERANAELIVRAVNAHDELVAALQTAIDEATDHGASCSYARGTPDAPCNCWQAQARQVLAHAEGNR